MAKLLLKITVVVGMLWIIAACSDDGQKGPSSGSGPSGGTPTPTPTATSTATPTATPPAPTATPIATQEVEFRVSAPETGDENAVRLQILFAGDFQELQQVEMQKSGKVWTATVQLPPSSLISYVYDHFKSGESQENFKGKREAHSDTVQVHSRLLLVASGRTLVEDVVETWNDTRAPAVTGTLSGIVTDAITGDPLIDVDVTAGGIHIATDFEGRFQFNNIAAGVQRVTAHTTLGDYRATDGSATVPAQGAAEVTIAMEPAEAVDVTFDVALPEETPPDAVIRVAGNVFQLGAARVFQNQPRLVQDISLPPLERVSQTRARGTFRLHEGTYLNYYFTLAGTFHGHEFTAENQFAYHESFVSASSPTLSDRVVAWKSEHQRMVELRITTPPNTDPNTFLGVVTGPTHIASRVSRTEFVTYLTGFPGETITYALKLGDHHEVADASSDAGPGGQRTVIVGETSTVEHVTVERWGAHPRVSAATPGTEVDIAFRASLPSGTPADASVRVVTSAGSAARSFGLRRVPGAQLWVGTLQLPAGAEVAYQIDASGAGPRLGPQRTLTVEYVGQVVDDWVTAWSDAPLPTGGIRTDYITGFHTPDFWSDGMKPLTESTYRRIAEHNGGWVALSSVWHYGTILPLPTIESRQLYSPGVLTPRPHVVEQARVAREMGLKTFLAPQFNMEMVPGFSDQINEIKSDGWRDGWFEVAEELWLYHADLAQDIDADLLMLPGFIYHVFSSSDRFESFESFQLFDERLIGLVDRVREVYSGRVLISGELLDSDLPGEADVVGITTFGISTSILPPSASVEEWYTTYDDLFKEVLDPKWERWGLPVLIYQLTIPASSGGEGDEVAQANQLEGIMRAIDERPWVAGSFTWAYHMVDQPIAENGLRARLGEAVLAKYYGMFSGQN